MPADLKPRRSGVLCDHCGRRYRVRHLCRWRPCDRPAPQRRSERLRNIARARRLVARAGSWGPITFEQALSVVAAPVRWYNEDPDAGPWRSTHTVSWTPSWDNGPPDAAWGPSWGTGNWSEENVEIVNWGGAGNWDD